MLFRSSEENGDSSPEKRTYELAFYIQVGSSLCGRRGTKGTFYTKGTVGVVVPQGQRALFIPSLFFFQYFRHLRKISLPLVLSILFCAQNRTQPWKLQQNTVVSTPSFTGDREHEGFKLNFQRAWVMEMTPDHPGISS